MKLFHNVILSLALIASCTPKDQSSAVAANIEDSAAGPIVRTPDTVVSASIPSPPLVCPGAACPVPDSLMVHRDACPFECCQYGQWVSEERLRAFERQGDTAHVAFTLPVGEAFTAHGGAVHIVQAGIRVLEAPWNDFAAGDTLYVLDYAGEGAHRAWIQGRVLHVDRLGMWEYVEYRALQRAESEWWVQVENAEGQEGWLLMGDHRISGYDACA